MHRHTASPLQQRSLAPAGGARPQLAQLRVKRSKMEAAFAANPTRVKALKLALLYEQMRDVIVVAAGIELPEDS